jgi:nitrite reductase/ring-hydroxylating ferredoxin subunit
MAERVICNSGELTDGGRGVRFELNVGAGGTAIPAFAVRHRGTVRAFRNQCGHVPVELDWEAGEFFDYSGHYLICATHGALYAPESGRCVTGRCNGRGLIAVAVVERDGVVYCIEEN